MSDDLMATPCCCLHCTARFAFGSAKTFPGSPHVHCPVCGAAPIQIIDGQIRYANWTAPADAVLQ